MPRTTLYELTHTSYRHLFLYPARTYAVVAERSFQPIKAPSKYSKWHVQHEINHETMELEECMLFVINKDGATKIVKQRHWGKYVRRIRTVDDV